MVLTATQLTIELIPLAAVIGSGVDGIPVSPHDPVPA
jgi:hypothetical protein